MTTGSSNWLPVWRRLAIYERDGWVCVYCGSGPRVRRDRAAASVVLSLDHVVTRAAGGTHANNNLVTACKACNSSRGDKAVEDYATGGAMERIRSLLTQPLDVETAKLLEQSLSGDTDR